MCGHCFIIGFRYNIRIIINEALVLRVTVYKVRMIDECCGRKRVKARTLSQLFRIYSACKQYNPKRIVRGAPGDVKPNGDTEKN